MENKENGLPGVSQLIKSSLSRKSIGLLVLIMFVVCFYVFALYIDIVPAILPSSVLAQADVSTNESQDPDPNTETKNYDITTASFPAITASRSEDAITAISAAGASAGTAGGAAASGPVTNTKTPNNKETSSINNTRLTNQPNTESGLVSNITGDLTNQATTDVITSELLRNPDLIGQCDRLPFLACDQTKVNISITKQFRVAMLRRSSWLGPLDFQNCEFSNCLSDGTLVTEKTDLVIVYVGYLNDNFRPPKRWPHQRYAAAVWESPLHTGASFLHDQNSVWNRAFNLTATYRTDSDIFVPYSMLRFKPKPLKERPNYLEIAKVKNKTAVWFVSNCKTPSRRQEYVKEMQKYIDVDIYGECGEPCSKDNPNCMANLPRHYKFYLSFENSLCTDYITEKLFKLFEPGMHIIPVVRGGANYDQHLPKNTFINAANFKTAKDLALHLQALAGDMKTYSKFLEHKDMYKSDPSLGLDGLSCAVCKFLNTKPMESKVYNMKSWMGDNHCKAPSDIT